MRKTTKSPGEKIVRAEIASRWGGKVNGAEKDLDLKKDTFRGVLRETATEGPRLNTISLIADALDLEFYFDPKRNIPLDPNPSEQIADEPEFVRVARYAVSLSAGPGAINDTEELVASVAFRADWMRGQGLQTDQCVVVDVRGDSMSPTLHHGDLVLINRAQTEGTNFEIYVLVDVDGEVRTKRLIRTSEELVLTSDNTDHGIALRKPDQTNQITIIGKVVWSGHAF